MAEEMSAEQRAFEVYRRWYGEAPDLEIASIYDDIASAIQEAVEEEREACAKEMDRYPHARLKGKTLGDVLRSRSIEDMLVQDPSGLLRLDMTAAETKEQR